VIEELLGEVCRTGLVSGTLWMMRWEEEVGDLLSPR